MILKRNKKEESDNLDPKDKEKLDIYKKGVAGGVTGAVVGGLTAGVGHIAEKWQKRGSGEINGKVREELQNRVKNISPESIRKAKGIGWGALGTGAALATASGIAYGVKKRKVKRKAEEKDDSAEK